MILRHGLKRRRVPLLGIAEGRLVTLRGVLQVGLVGEMHPLQTWIGKELIRGDEAFRNLADRNLRQLF